MLRRTIAAPYVLAGIAVLAVILLAWLTRDRFQPVGPGQEAPAFQAVNLQGDSVSLEDHRGKVILLNIWATWCPPCREEMPSMQRLHEALEGRDFEIIAVSVDAEEGTTDEQGNVGGDVAEFVEEYGLTFTVLHDPSGRIQDTYQTTGVPESFVINRDGIIYQKVSGASEWDDRQHRQLIERLLDGGSSG